LAGETLLRAVTAAGIDAEPSPSMASWHGSGRLSSGALSPTGPGLAWLDDHRPSKAREAAICHGDFHPLNILTDKNQPTGVIDWANAVIAEPPWM